MLVVVLGYLLRHRTFGPCKVVQMKPNAFEVKFCVSGERKIFSAQALQAGDFSRSILSIGDQAIGPRGLCEVIRQPSLGKATGQPSPPYIYPITYKEDGLAATVSELELMPLGVSHNDTLQSRLLQGRTESYLQFAARHKLMNALSRLNRQVGGLRSLLAGRLDLHPHQAFVSGTIVLDPIRRYILADEVGLGKTIEAGVVIHDLLSRRPEARVLVLTPGPLCRQWLCEMHSSFGGQGFKLADLHPIDDVDLRRWRKLICSTAYALDGLDEALLNVNWDMVVIDEVHHLLNAPHLYALVQGLSHRTRDLLLLSAIPMRRREAELFRLLALLEPDLYREGGQAEKRFLEIYASQEALGRRLNLLARDLADLDAGEAGPEEVIERAERLLSLPILEGDRDLENLIETARAAPQEVGVLCRRIHTEVADRYRVNRRILRNRRERLISQERLTAIHRRLEVHEYLPDQIEEEAFAAVEALLVELASSNAPPEIVRPFARIVLQALSDAQAIIRVLEALSSAKAAKVNAYGLELLNSVVGLGGGSWKRLFETACAGVAGHIVPQTLQHALRRAKAWARSSSSQGRQTALIALLAAEIAAGRKTLVFAGFPGSAERLVVALRQRFGRAVVAAFTSDMEDADKEESVRGFRADPRVLVMVSDESGGEGRNFQFAHSLVHVDLPWQVSVLEQRIGRLDRLGRDLVSTEVTSHVLANATAWERGLLACYSDGLHIFENSISGLEFALRDLQDRMLNAALTSGQDGLLGLSPEIAQAVADERTKDQGEALLDEASFHAIRAERFSRARVDGIEEAIETAFIEYFRHLGAPKSVWPHKNHDLTEGVWCFRPDDLRHGEINIVDRSPAGELGKRIGTFRRDIAQRALDLEFFSYGNPLFDAVAAALTSRLTGRTYAIICRAGGFGSFVGVELILAARPDLGALTNSPSLLNLADAIFGDRRRSIFVPLLEGQVFDPATIEAVRNGLNLAKKGTQWQDLDGAAVQRLAAAQGGDLAGCVQRALSHDLQDARAVFAAELDEAVAHEVQRVEEHCRFLAQRGGDEAATELEELARYAAVLQGWNLVIDGIGFLAINPRA